MNIAKWFTNFWAVFGINAFGLLLSSVHLLAGSSIPALTLFFALAHAFILGGLIAVEVFERLTRA